MLTALFIAGSPIRSSGESPGAVVFMATFAIVSTIFSFGWSGSWQTKIIIRWSTGKRPNFAPLIIISSLFLEQLTKA